MKKIAVAAALIAAALIAAAPASAQEAGKTMNQAEAQAWLKGQVGGTNSRWTVNFKFDDGVVWGNATNGGSDSANYEVAADGTLCTKWRGRWEDWCGKLVGNANGGVDVVNAQGVYITLKK